MAGLSFLSWSAGVTWSPQERSTANVSGPKG